MIVYTVGTFDLLHVGHLALLNHCKSLGDVLAVGVASDEVKGEGWNEPKRERLIKAGADIMVCDFQDAQALTDYLFPA